MSDTARALPETVSALPASTRLAEFEIKSRLGVGGFGIVYLAFDHALEREVAIKEYMPASMAGRTATLHVSIRSQSDAEVFALGLRSFVNEAKLLARFDHPSLIKVHRFWEANGTAYMAMPVLRGSTLRDIRKRTGRGPDEAWIRNTLAPLLGALEQLHNAGVYHRDIAPDNIHLEAEGRPVLLDFGAARRVISGKTQTLTAILKPAYAPIEQYGESDAVKQGPWTDIYALGATLHYMLLGYPPAPATVRTVADDSTALAAQAIPGVTPQTLAVIDWMLAPRPADRPQSVAELREALEGRRAVPARASSPAPTPKPQWDKTLLSNPSAVTIPLGDGTEHADLELDLAASPPAALRATAAPAPRPTVQTSGKHAQGLVGSAPAELPMAADDGHRLHPPASRTRLLPLALAGLLLAGVAGYFAWVQFGPSLGAAPATAATATTASPATSDASAASPSRPQAATPEAAASASVAAEPAAPAAPAAVGTAASAVTVAEAAGGMAPASAAAPGAAAVPTVPARTATGSGNSAATHGAASASSANAVAPAIPARPVSAAGPAARTGAAAAQEAGRGASPEAHCAGRNSLSHFVCMERECARPRFKNHPECLAQR